MLFDLGNTLAAYYRREEFGPILERSVSRTRDQLMSAGLNVVALEVAMERAARREPRSGRLSVRSDGGSAGSDFRSLGSAEGRVE